MVLFKRSIFTPSLVLLTVQKDSILSLFYSSPRCAVAPLQGRVEKILTWRWKEEDEEKKPSDDDSKQKGAVPVRAEREFFIKWKEQVIPIDLF